MDSPNYQFETKTEYKDRDKGTGAWAIKPGPPAIPPIPFVPGEPVFTEDFEGIPWSDLFLVSVDGWSVQTIDAHSPTHSFETDHLGAYVYSFVFNDFSFSPQLSFWYKTDLVPSAGDFFEVLFDGLPVLTVTEPVLDWTYFAIDKGFAFNIEFRFTQVFPIVTNSVFVRVDDIVVGELDTPGVPGSPAHPFVYTPLVLCEDDRLLVSPASKTILEVPEVIVETEDFETDPITGSGTWTLTGSSPHTGLRCLRSAVIGDSQSTDYTFAVPVGADTIRFWSRVSSEGGFDFFRVYKDAVDPDNLLYQNSGTANIWEQQTLDITGATSVIFRYIKDSSASSGEDAAFIDDIEWVTAAIPEHEECAPLQLNSDGDLNTRPLDCETDSITVCPPVSGVFDVEVINEVNTRPLDCETDSITVCPPVSGVFDVEVTNEVNIRPLTCVTDSVSACLDEPIEVFGVGGGDVEVHINGDVIVQAQHPGVPGTVITGSRWHATGYNSGAATLTIVSPTPGVGQRIVCDWWDYRLLAVSLSLGAGTSHPLIRDGAGGTVIWQTAFGLLGTIAVGATYGDAQTGVLVGSANNILQFQLPATISIFDKTLNFGGYIVQL